MKPPIEIEFIDKVYPNLYKELYTNGCKLPKYESIAKYLGQIRQLLEQEESDLFSYFDAKYIIKPENISVEYCKNLELRYEQIGFKKEERTREAIWLGIIKDQEYSLHIWLKFMKEKIDQYPIWFLYWVLQGVLRVGSFNIGKQSYSKRTPKTIVPFLECYPQAIALLYETMHKVLIEKQTISDPVLEKFINNGNFEKSYQWVWNLAKEQEQYTKNGIWIDYPQYCKPEPLVQSLEFQGTNWCTAITPYTTSKEHMWQGNFSVYYTYDEEKKATNPKLAIRSENDRIIEIRGTRPYQNVDLDLLETLEAKVNQFHGIGDAKETISYLYQIREILSLTDGSLSKDRPETNSSYFGFAPDPILRKIKDRV